MKNRPQLKRSLGLRRPVNRTLQGWALGILIDQGAVVAAMKALFATGEMRELVRDGDFNVVETKIKRAVSDALTH